MSEHAITVTPKRCYEAVRDCLYAKVVPMISGSPGVGKSAIIQQLCEELGLKLIDLRLSQCDPTDLNGFPSIDKETGKASYVPLDTFPTQHDKLPLDKDGKELNGWLLFLDELPSAPLAVQAASYKLVLDHAVGQHKLHKNVKIVAAGNKSTDNAIVNRMSTAMQSRMVHLEMDVSSEDWIEWAQSNKLDYRVVSFISNDPDQLHRFDPDHNDVTFPCPRTWEIVSRLMKNWGEDIADKHLALLAGSIGSGMAAQFLEYCNVFKQIPTYDQIVQKGAATPVPTDSSILFAVAGRISSFVTAPDLNQVMKYVEKFPMEFQVITVKDMLRRNRMLLGEAPIKSWIGNNSMDLFGSQ